VDVLKEQRNKEGDGGRKNERKKEAEGRWKL
jgi:hypothetical protein